MFPDFNASGIAATMVDHDAVAIELNGLATVTGDGNLVAKRTRDVLRSVALVKGLDVTFDCANIQPSAAVALARCLSATFLYFPGSIKVKIEPEQGMAIAVLARKHKDASPCT